MGKYPKLHRRSTVLQIFAGLLKEPLVNLVICTWRSPCQGHVLPPPHTKFLETVDALTCKRRVCCLSGVMTSFEKVFMLGRTETKGCYLLVKSFEIVSDSLAGTEPPSRLVKSGIGPLGNSVVFTTWGHQHETFNWLSNETTGEHRSLQK